MAITYEKNRAIFASVIYEDEVISFRDFLQEKAPEEVKLEFSECEDVHLAVLQIIMAYKKNYPISYEFGKTKKLFQKVLEGFVTSENHCY
ncbi:hypothetical protein [Sulfurimonas sp.]|uniref:hypothetical protein n=1 Tax=Sulfurimonas sp. TaxID=2022749 RepID=UPI002AB2F80E|nr:hypothetical protein [Sulfurimonas sp.]